MTKSYIDSVGYVIYLSTGQDLTNVTTTKILVKTPSGEELTWDAEVATADEDGVALTPVDGVICYVVQEDDLNTSGVYILQSYLEWGTVKIPGESVEFMVYPLYG